MSNDRSKSKSCVCPDDALLLDLKLEGVGTQLQTTKSEANLRQLFCQTPLDTTARESLGVQQLHGRAAKGGNVYLLSTTVRIILLELRVVSPTLTLTT